MRLALLVVLVACAAPAKNPAGEARDGACAGVAWSCVGMQPNSEISWGCTEGTASQTSRSQASCTLEKSGRFALNACLRDDAVGGCTRARGADCTTTWYHAPATRETVLADCAKQGAAFTVP